MKIAAVFAAMLLASGTASAELADWQTDGAGTWSFDAESNSWFQATNTPDFTFLYDPSDTSLNKAISGSISVGGRNDDDFIGFALGYSPGEVDDPLADYWLVSWKKGNQGGWTKGLNLWHITGDINADPWNNGTNPQITKIQSAKSLGSTGWSHGEEYTFDLTYESGTLSVFIDEELELAVSSKDAGVDSFEDGGFAYFNFSQDSVTYNSVLFDDIGELINDEQKNAIVSAVPVQGLGFASLFMLGAGLIGAAGRKRT